MHLLSLLKLELSNSIVKVSQVEAELVQDGVGCLGILDGLDNVHLLLTRVRLDRLNHLLHVKITLELEFETSEEDISGLGDLFSVDFSTDFHI